MMITIWQVSTKAKVFYVSKVSGKVDSYESINPVLPPSKV
tara:strand:+ start:783 stop:902 length:120 start_codon:yes stop_codon:yes gene_type:complete